MSDSNSDPIGVDVSAQAPGSYSGGTGGNGGSGGSDGTAQTAGLAAAAVATSDPAVISAATIYGLASDSVVNSVALATDPSSPVFVSPGIPTMC